MLQYRSDQGRNAKKATDVDADQQRYNHTFTCPIIFSQTLTIIQLEKLSFLQLRPSVVYYRALLMKQRDIFMVRASTVDVLILTVVDGILLALIGFSLILFAIWALVRTRKNAKDQITLAINVSPTFTLPLLITAHGTDPRTSFI
eukprot:Filipodium_phascolosomae@DN6012_c0_g1_i1.p1